MSKCHKCNGDLPPKARFCPYCGEAQQQQFAGIVYAVQWDADLVGQLMEFWNESLKKRLEEEDDSQKLPVFLERIYSSGFRDTLQRRLAHLAEYLAHHQFLLQNDQRALSHKIGQTLEELLDFFCIRHCRDLLRFTLPEKVLKYQGQSLADLNLYQLILDYLDFASEQIAVYTNFFEMPKSHFKNATRYFLFAANNERIYFICNLSLLGGCQDGFAMTEKTIFWKAPLEKARQIAYGDLSDIQLKSEWLLINDYFFNGGPSLNYKLYKLLKKLISLFG